MMLVITRKPGEKVIIGDNIVVQVLYNNNDSRQIKLGIAAPKDVPVHREEIYDKIQREKAGLAIGNSDRKNRYQNEDRGNR